MSIHSVTPAPVPFEFDDLQALLRFGHGRLTDTRFLLLHIADASIARQWLQTVPISTAAASNPPPEHAAQIAFTVAGLRAFGLPEATIATFSDEFISGIAGEESRSRRLGDIGDNAPTHWDWGFDPHMEPHVLLLLYARAGGLQTLRDIVENNKFNAAFTVINTLPTDDLGRREPFGFIDGISQPNIDWTRQQSIDQHARDKYTNWLAPGEVVLGYPNEYGLYTTRPLINADVDALANKLPAAEDQPNLKDFARNGSYLVIRQLSQDVPGFWQFLDQQVEANPANREQLAAAMVGRHQDGTPLVAEVNETIPGISAENQNNRFTYAHDPGGYQCPIGAHVRRANPRTGDYPPGVAGLFSRLVRALGFGQTRDNEDIVASTRFHRLLRRGRAYGPRLEPVDAVKVDALKAERGLLFVCLVANISRQFEFVQNAWIMSAKFNGVHQESDPLIGNRQPLMNDIATDCFHRADPSGPRFSTCHLPQFTRCRGGGYFFLPGLRALRYLASLPDTREPRA